MVMSLPGTYPVVCIEEAISSGVDNCVVLVQG